MSLLFAALYSDRVAALCVYGSLPRFLWAPDFPSGRPQGEWRAGAGARRGGLGNDRPGP